MRALAPLLVLPLLALAAPAASVAPVLHPACADAQTPVLFLQWETQLENLAFDGAGALYVSDFGGDQLLRVTQDVVEVVDSLPMHGMTFGPDGLLYVGVAEEDAQVWRYHSLSPVLREQVAGGLVSANGMAFDDAGNLFVSNPGLGSGAPYLARLPADDMAAWSEWSTEYGFNGLWLSDGRILAAITADQSSPIVSVSTSDPEDVQVVAELTLGAATLQPGAHPPRGDAFLAPKGLDDLTLGPDGMIYAAAHVTGELLRVDPVTGDACAYASGFEEPTSVRVAVGFGAWDGWLFVTDMGGAGVTALFGPGAGAVWAVPLG